MTTVAPTVLAAEDRRFLALFIILSVISGLTVGLGKIVSTLYAISLHATPFQIGLISAMESVGMVLVTVPAGFIIARYGARGVYFMSSLGPMLINLAMPFSGSWVALALGRGAIGLCIPFRMVSMNGSFLERLPRFGPGKAGWYRASLTGGVAILGPSLAAFLTTRGDVTTIFFLVSACFAIMALFSLSFLPDRDPRGAQKEVRFVDEIVLIVRSPAIAESCLVEFTSAATNALFSTFIILLAASLPGLTEQDGIRIMLVQGFAVVGLLFFGGTLAARLSNPVAYGLSLVSATVALLSFAYATSFAVLALGAVLLAVGAAIVHLINMRVMAGLPGGKSKVAGLYNLASMTGASFGAIAGGAITTLVPLQWVFLIWLPLLLVAGLLAQWLNLRRRREGSLALQDI
ncbi:MAG TPA: MFS transporter [Sphingobium sp.]